MNSAVVVQNLSKQYRLGTPVDHDQQMLRDVLVHAAKSAVGKFRRRFNGAGTEVNGAGRRPTTVHSTLPSAAPGGTAWIAKPHSDPHAKEFWALRDVSFDVRPGEVIGIIGKNGAGKSTLLKVLSRITEPSSGRVELRGRVASLLEVGTGFHPELTGRENIFLNGAILGMSRREIASKFDEIVDFAEIEEFLDTPVKRYSSGMYVRLAFAVAAHLEPEILIIDEVLAVGDFAFQQKCMGRVAAVASEGRTVLFVSHNMTAVKELCERAILMSHGRIADQGPVDGVIDSYVRDAADSEDGVFDLSAHATRSAWLPPIIRQMTLGRHGKGGTIFYPDDPFEVELVIEPVTPIRLPRVAITIADNYGRRLLTVASFHGNDPLPEIAGRTVLRCVIPDLRLCQGRYLVGASVSMRLCGLLDSVDHAAWFTVLWNNNYGNGEPYHAVYGPVLSQSSWSVKEDCGVSTVRTTG